MTTEAGLADRLLDAQVGWVLDQLSGDRLQAVIVRDVDEVLAIAETIRLDALVTPEDVIRITERLLATVPASTATSTLLEAGVDLGYDGPGEPVRLAEVLQRAHVEALVDEVLALHPVVERALDGLADSPMVGTVASRFVTRIVVDVVQANRAMAEKIPGVGSMLSLGTSAASKVMGAAERPMQMVGDQANKGAAFAVRRLNKVVIDTLRDPLLRDAVMEVWDQHADQPLADAARAVEREDVHRIAGLLQEVVIHSATTEPVRTLVTAAVHRFFDIYGEYPVTTLLEELEVTRDDIVAELQVVLPQVIEAAREDGRLATAVRDRLEPFFRSDAVAAILGT